MALTYDPIFSTTIPLNVLNFTISGIPNIYTDLILVTSLRGTRIDNAAEDFYIRFNSDASNNYSRTYVYGNGTSALSGRDSSSAFFFSNAPSATSSFNGFSVDIMHIMSYTSTNLFKTIVSTTSNPANSDLRQVGLWRSTSVISSMTVQGINGNITSGSTFSLYGIKAA